MPCCCSLYAIFCIPLFHRRAKGFERHMTPHFMAYVCGIVSVANMGVGLVEDVSQLANLHVPSHVGLCD